MNIIYSIVIAVVRPYVSREFPGWGRIYDIFIGGYKRNNFWRYALPRVIRDKRYALLRLLDLREWADRSFFFLNRWYDLPAQLTLDLILERGNNVVDAGANYGHFSLAAASIVGEKGTVIAFEPNPSAFSRLQTHINLNRLHNIKAHNAGLAEAPGELSLNVPKINSGEASFAGTQYADFERVCCPVYAGDDKIGQQKITCIKIDVEGFEVRVLAGLQLTIERDRPWIITEVVRPHLARDNRTPSDLNAMLEPYGYTPMLVGLTGQPGAAKQLALRSFNPDTDEGDVLWVPESRRDIVKSVFNEVP